MRVGAAKESRLRPFPLSTQCHSQPSTSQKVACRPGDAPGKRSFGDSVARLAPGIWKLERPSEIASEPSPWQRDILLLNHGRKKLMSICGCQKMKRRGAVLLRASLFIEAAVRLSRRTTDYLQQRTNTIAVSLSLSCSHRNFSVDVSVFWGTPPAKPLKCKFKLNSVGDIAAARGSSAGLCERLRPILIASTSFHFITPMRFVSFHFPNRSSDFPNKKALLPSGKQGSNKSGMRLIRLPPVRLCHDGNGVPLAIRSKDFGQTSDHRPACNGSTLR